MTFRVERLTPALTALLMLSGATAVLAQSLADVAKQEEHRRQGIKQPAKVYTNKDLHSVPPVIGGTAPVSDTAAGADASADKGSAASTGSGAGDKPEKSDKKDDKTPQKDQAYWSNRVKQLKAQLDRDQTFAEALQTRINALTADFASHDDPAQREVIRQNRQKALDELERLKKAIADDKKALSDLEDEARRAGVPPGWLRS